ncbi:hypothetical protein [Bacillus alveayuensis]|jgi:hypothetical protein|uniref:hypothetical protein n=1 Tax=Aeribacillus alveayuensis TaxID=279215 RepID=UPI000A5A4647|nr:hypothetical protein [Bacillus alveayuensis]
MKKTKTTDEEITLRLKKEKEDKHIKTTDEEFTLEFMREGDNGTRQPKDYEQIEY